MRRLVALLVAALVGAPVLSPAQTRPGVRRPPVSPLGPAKTTAPEITCPSPLGAGVNTKAFFCDVMTGRDPAAGILIAIPSHRGSATLRFDLHNRQTYSAEQVQANRAYARYTATIGVLTMDNTLISRAVVRNEFRTAADLVDRISGGAGPGGVKAVAPTGVEPIEIAIPESEDEVSLLGEKLTIERVDGAATYTAPDRPIAVISNVTIEYHPAPPKPVRKKRTA